MPYFLFVVDMPQPGISSEDAGAPTRWFHFVPIADAIELPPGAKKMPCKNVWLFPVEGSAPQRRALEDAANAQKLGYSTFLVSGEVTKL